MATTIRTAAQAAAAGPGKHKISGAVGLYLRKTSDKRNGGAWVYRFWFGGKRLEMGLGSLTDVSLADARDEVLRMRLNRRAGLNPIALKRATKGDAAARGEAAALAASQWTFAQAAESYLKAHSPSWKHPRARQVWFSPIKKYAYPVIGRMPLDLIRVQHVDAVMTAAVEGGAPQVAPRIRLRIEQILNAAAALGKRNAELPNPANVKLVKAVRPTRDNDKREHFRRIPLADAPAALGKLKGLTASSTPLAALVFMIATASRPSEALGAKWDEIDVGRKLWAIPAARMKGGKEHIVPLSSLALAVLERQTKVRVGDAVFSGLTGGSMSYGAFAAVARKLPFDVGAPHSWRSIFRDWAGDIGGIARETAEAALAHSLGRVESAYRRETGVLARSLAMQRYADWLEGEAGDVVVAFPARA
jgi:integrase